MHILTIGIVFLAGLALAAAAAETTTNSEPPPQDPPRFALAIHGGAGAISRDRATPELRDQYLQALSRVLEHGRKRLEAGAPALDVVEECVRMLEDDELFNAGRGSVLNAEGDFELDASIMDGSTLAAGGVTGVRTVKNPVSLARLVMEQTGHVLLGGQGAEAFADDMGVERVEPAYFEIPRRREALQRELERRRREQEQTPGENQPEPDRRGTVGAVALDIHGNLAAATSTGGRNAKMPGRIGDSPINGAGNYANNATCAVSGTGVGEEFIRHMISREVHVLMEHRGMSLEDAANTVVFERLQPGHGGVIAVCRDGTIAMPYNTRGMFRGAADSKGRFDVAIWND